MTSFLRSESGGLDDLEVMPGQVIGLGKITEPLDRNRRVSREEGQLLFCL